MTRSTVLPSPAGDTPWLLFVGILMMALVPAMFSQQKVRDFEGRLTDIQESANTQRKTSDRQQIKLKQIESFQQHHQRRVLPKIAKEIEHMASLPPKVQAAVDGQAASMRALNALSAHVERLEQRLPKMLADVDQRLALLDKTVGACLTREEFKDTSKDLARAENMRKLAGDNMKNMQSLLQKSLEDHVTKAEQKYEPFIKKLQGKTRLFATRAELNKAMKAQPDHSALIKKLTGKDRMFATRAELTKIVTALKATRDMLAAQKEVIEGLKVLIIKQQKSLAQADANAKAIVELRKAVDALKAQEK